MPSPAFPRTPLLPPLALSLSSFSLPPPLVFSVDVLLFTQLGELRHAALVFSGNQFNTTKNFI